MPREARQGEGAERTRLWAVVLSRTVSRVFVVFGVLAAVAAWRLDAAVSTAYRTAWVAPRFAKREDIALFGCTNCWRLPSEAWLWADALSGAAALISLVIAAFLFHLRHRPPKTDTAADQDSASARDEKRRREQARAGVHHFAIGVACGVGLLAVAAVVMRQLGTRGHGTGWVTAGSWVQVAGFALTGLIVVAAAAGSPSTESGPYTFVRRVARFLHRQRVNVLGLALLTAAIMFIPQTSAQAIDSIRTWGLDSAHSIARLGFGVGAVLLLSLVVYEGAVQLTQVSSRDPRIHVMRTRVWFAIGGALVVLGIVLVAAGPFGWGPIAVGTLVLLLGLLDWPDLEPRRTGVEWTEDELEAQRRYDERVAEILAVVPLLLFAATGVAAAIDAALSRGTGRALGPLVPTAILAVIAILMTAERLPSRFDVPKWRESVAAVVIVGVGSLLLIVSSSELVAAIVALVGCTVGLLYAFVVFWVRPPPKSEWTASACCSALSLPMAGAVGFGVFLAVHGNPFGSANTIGTLAVVCLGSAFWLAILNLLVFLTYHLRPPRALGWIGFDRLPIVTLIAIAWIAAGAIRTPPTLHETRLTERQTINADGKEVIPGAPTLSEAFDAWIAAQPELAGGGGSSGPPVTMFLVAAHGGGIRAAYWTALALDCIVGISAASFDNAKLAAGDDDTRKATCESTRRTPEQQQAAARRIFVASGVSGGAFGLYAYARQLIAKRSLGDGSWVNKRLARDFASATIGWGLFHDAAAHWFGLNSHRGGACGWKIGARCMTADRAAILEQTFDRAWPDADQGTFAPRLRVTWDMRLSADEKSRNVARTIPLLIMNTTVTGGKARGVVSTANLGSWPMPEAHDPGRGNFDAYPLAGTVEVVEAMCATKDLRLSTAALLAGRFPYVSPAGHISGQCRRSKGGALGADRNSACANAKAAVCEMRLVDGGYAENSGLFTIDALWPSLRQLVTNFNRTSDRDIAPVIVELDNHYQATLDTELAARGTAAESVVPLATAFGARNSMETFARALAYRLRPPGCTVTISPGLHPGLTAPLGWELSKGARDDLQDGLTRPHPTAVGAARYEPVLELRRLQQWLGGGQTPKLEPTLESCVPLDTTPKR